MTPSPPFSRRPWFPRYKGMILFFAGLIGVIYEASLTLFSRSADPSLLVIFAGMMGLPAFLPARRDENEE